MTIKEIEAMVCTKKYDFLWSNPHLGKRIIFLTLGGSHAYGTNVDDSDVDIRGCALNSATDMLGLTHFEQVVNTATDTTVYGFNKFIQLLMECNPNIIEMMGCKPEHYILMTDIGQQLIDNRKMFISQKAASSFGGYATQQLRRLENALARDKMPQAMLEEHILVSMKGAIRSFKDRYKNFDEEHFHLYTADSDRDDVDREIFIDLDLKKFPARQLISMLNDLANVIKTYDKLSRRNKKKDDAHLNKHAMHLVRLYLMGIELLETGEIHTHREKDLDLLMSIRRGYYQNSDGTYHSSFFDMVTELDEKLMYAKEHTSLPVEPDLKKIEEFMVEINKQAIAKE